MHQTQTNNSLSNLLSKITASPEEVQFAEVIEVIGAHYDYTPTRFINGHQSASTDDRVINEAGKNEGSCKILAFAQINKLDEQQTLNCFGDYYRNDVLKNPEGNDHANIRTFIKYGWGGVHFLTSPLKQKKKNGI